LFPTWLLLDSLDQFGQESPQTRIEVIESVLSGTAEALLTGKADIAITPQIPPGFFGELLMRTPIIAVAAPDHPLHKLERKLTRRDLRNHRHITVRDTGSQRDRRAVMVEVEQRWTVSHMATSIEALCAGYGFSWLPTERIKRELADGRLKPLPLREGQERWVDIYLIVADPDFAGPGVRRLADILRARVKTACNAIPTGRA
jgi:DNA-binding transcriptional LysR family regulator